MESNEDSSLMAIDTQNFQLLIGRRNPEKNTILHLAARLGKDAVVKFLTAKEPFLVSTKNFNSDNPLHFAIRVGHFTILKMLFKVIFDGWNGNRKKKKS